MRHMTVVLGHCFIVIAAFSLASCGGGEGSPYQPDGTSPVISNLVVSPASALHNEGGGSVYFDVSVDFTDQEGDVYYMGTNVLDSSGSLLYASGALLPLLSEIGRAHV